MDVVIEPLGVFAGSAVAGVDPRVMGIGPVPATRKLMEVAYASAKGRLVSVLEGGYDLQGLANSVAAHVAALMQV